MSDFKKTYTIRYDEHSVKLVSIEAANEAEALAKFYKMVNEHKIDFSDMEVVNTSTKVMED